MQGATKGRVPWQTSQSHSALSENGVAAAIIKKLLGFKRHGLADPKVEGTVRDGLDKNFRTTSTAWGKKEGLHIAGRTELSANEL